MECSRMHFFPYPEINHILGYSSSARRLPVEIFFKPSSYLPTAQARRKIYSRFSSPRAARPAFLFPAGVQPKLSPSSLSPCARISIPSKRATSRPSSPMAASPASSLLCSVCHALSALAPLLGARRHGRRLVLARRPSSLCSLSRPPAPAR
jgi:hypothetical protein